MRILPFVLVICLTASALAADAETRSAVKLYEVSNSEELIAAVKEMPSAGALVLKPGVYEITEPLVFENKNLVTITGSGWNTQIVRQGEGDALVFRDSAFCVVKDLLINGDRDAKKGSGIVFDGNCSSCTVDFCRICLFPESGIRFDGSEKSPQSSNTVRNCHLINNSGDQLRSARNNDFYITGNQFGADRWGRGERPVSGCLLEESSAGTYSMNYHWGNVNALKMIGCKFNRVENNRFEESRESGIVIGDSRPWSGGAYNIILGNTIHTNSQGELGAHPAVIARNASMFQFCTNQILSWDSNSTRHRNGLVLEAGCGKWIVKDNIIHHSTEKALVYEENAGHIVKDNITE